MDDVFNNTVETSSGSGPTVAATGTGEPISAAGKGGADPVGSGTAAGPGSASGNGTAGPAGIVRATGVMPGNRPGSVPGSFGAAIGRSSNGEKPESFGKVGPGLPGTVGSPPGGGGGAGRTPLKSSAADGSSRPSFGLGPEFIAGRNADAPAPAPSRAAADFGKKSIP
ncbi:MAG: hypothetical protein B9S34_08860 [Opitutia bacterium Tous-C1TDCM]|nr:MAG: hypothetical protein B9S34_08860 [Opitutae bacterium Tous-C1TDCM]